MPNRPVPEYNIEPIAPPPPEKERRAVGFLFALPGKMGTGFSGDSKVLKVIKCNNTMFIYPLWLYKHGIIVHIKSLAVIHPESEKLTSQANVFL